MCVGFSLWPEADKAVDKRIEQDSRDKLERKMVFELSFGDMDIVAYPCCQRKKDPDYVAN